MSTVTFREQEPEVVPGTAPALLPPTAEEVQAVLDGIDRLIQRNPSAVVDPTLLLVVRLGVAFLNGNAPVPSEPTGELQRLTEENRDLREKLVAARAETTKANRIADDAQGQVNSLSDDLALTKRHLEEALRQEPDVESERIKAELQSVVNVLGNAAAKVPANHPTATKVQKLIQDHARTTTEFGGARERILVLEKERQQAQTAAETKVEDAQKKVTKARKAVLDREYAGFSNQYTFRNNGKKIPCCPVCGGLNPNVVENTPAAGHRKGCWFVDLINALP